MIPSGPKMQAQDAKEYMELIEQAIFEVEDLGAAIKFDEDYRGEMDGFVVKLEKHLQELKQSLDPAAPELTGKDLPFMDVVRETDIAFLPFKHLMLRINATNKLGYNSQGMNVRID
jgi:hypothetical protein